MGLLDVETLKKQTRFSDDVRKLFECFLLFGCSDSPQIIAFCLIISGKVDTNEI